MPLMAWAAVLLLFVQDTMARGGIQGPFTVAVFAAGVLLLPPSLMRLTPKARDGRESTNPNRRIPSGLLWLFPLWATLLLLGFGVTKNGIQNVMLYWLFPITVATVAAAATPGTPLRFRRWVVRAAMLAAVGYIALAATVGAGVLEGFHGARGAGWGGTVALAILVPFAAYRIGPPWPLWVILLAIGLSLSRTPTVIALALLLLLAFRGRRGMAFIRLAALTAAAGFAAWWAYANIPAIHDRFVGGDNGSLFGVALNTSGRSTLWSLTLDHFHASGNPLVGLGPGSVERYLLPLTGQDHPHNDYLRLLHDTGYVGLALWLIGALAVLIPALRRWRRATDPLDKACHLAAVATMATLLLGAVTDNVVISLLEILPAGTALGLSLSRSEGDGLGERAHIPLPVEVPLEDEHLGIPASSRRGHI